MTRCYEGHEHSYSNPRLQMHNSKMAQDIKYTILKYRIA